MWTADRLGLGEAKRIFTNSKNVKDRLWDRSGSRARGALSTVRRSPMELLTARPRELGDYILFPSRIEILKRQSLAIEAMRT